MHRARCIPRTLLKALVAPSQASSEASVHVQARAEVPVRTWRFYAHAFCGGTTTNVSPLHERRLCMPFGS